MSVCMLHVGPPRFHHRRTPTLRCSHSPRTPLFRLQMLTRVHSPRRVVSQILNHSSLHFVPAFCSPTSALCISKTASSSLTSLASWTRRERRQRRDLLKMPRLFKVDSIFFPKMSCLKTRLMFSKLDLKTLTKEGCKMRVIRSSYAIHQIGTLF